MIWILSELFGVRLIDIPLGIQILFDQLLVLLFTVASLEVIWIASILGDIILATDEIFCAVDPVGVAKINPVPTKFSNRSLLF